jgi:hypothetical protein
VLQTNAVLLMHCLHVGAGSGEVKEEPLSPEPELAGVVVMVEKPSSTEPLSGGAAVMVGASLLMVVVLIGVLVVVHDTKSGGHVGPVFPKQMPACEMRHDIIKRGGGVI